MSRLEKSGMYIEDGEQKIYSVEENPSTGYEWIVDKSACSEDIVSIDDDFEKAIVPEDYVGAPGTKHFIFTGISEGSCEFRMAYARPWEFKWGDESTYNDDVEFISFPLSIG